MISNKVILVGQKCLMCTLHPVIIYDKQNNTLSSINVCFLLDDLEHDATYVHAVQCETVKFIKSKVPVIKSNISVIIVSCSFLKNEPQKWHHWHPHLIQAKSVIVVILAKLNLKVMKNVCYVRRLGLLNLT